MKKGYLVYLLVMSLLCATGLVALNGAVKKAKANLEANEERIIAFEKAIAAASAPSRANASNDTAMPGIAEPVLAKNPEPEKAAAPTPKQTPAIDLGGAPSCADLSHLRQAVNPTPNGTQYRGQLLVARGTGARLEPCGDTFIYTDLTNEGYQSESGGPLPPATYPLPYGTLIVHSSRR